MARETVADFLVREFCGRHLILVLLSLVVLSL
jgi:hypothetical protein